MTAEWLSMQITKRSSSVFSEYLSTTNTFLGPLLKAFDMESYYYFVEPCYEKYPAAEEDDSCCWQGGGCQCGNKFILFVYLFILIKS